jgi:hypothetical protein
LFVLPVSAEEKRFAKPGDGITLGQTIIPLDGESAYAVADQKVVPLGLVFVPDEIEEIRKGFMNHLNRQRYWESGVPPETTALERFHAHERRREQREDLLNSLADENWVKHGAGALPHREKSESG